MCSFRQKDHLLWATSATNQQSMFASLRTSRTVAALVLSVLLFLFYINFSTLIKPGAATSMKSALPESLPIKIAAVISEELAHPDSSLIGAGVVSSKEHSGSLSSKEHSGSRWSHNVSFMWPSNILEFTRSLQKLKSLNFDIQYNVKTAEQIPINERVQHHWSFKLAKLIAPKVPYDPQYWVDFLGVKTDVNFDGFNSPNPSSWLLHTKREHELLGKTLKKGDLIPIGIFPAFDQDYLDCTELLTLIYTFCFDEQSEGPFVYIEAGANYGVWAVRVAVYIRYLCPWKGSFVVAVESLPANFEQLKQHMRNNGVPESQYRIENRLVGTQTDETHISVIDLILPFKTVHVLNLDIQGAEVDVMQHAQTRALIAERTMFVQLENHVEGTDLMILQTFQHLLFKTTKAWVWPSGGCGEDVVHFRTEFGIVNFCQSLYSFFNYRRTDSDWKVIALGLL